MKKTADYFSMHQVVLFLDQEISTFSPTHLPNKKQFWQSLIQALLSRCDETVPKLSEKLFLKFSFDTLARALYSELGEQIYPVFNIFRTNVTNPIHHKIAWLMAHHQLPMVITLSLDDCLEQALLAQNMKAGQDYFVYDQKAQCTTWSPDIEKPIILKLRGSLHDHESLNQGMAIYEYGLGHEKIEILAYALRKYYSILLGMDGVFPYLHHYILETLPCSCPGILVIEQNPEVITDIQRAIQFYGHAIVIRKESQDDFLNKLFQQLGHKIPDLPTTEAHTMPNYHDYLSKWAQELSLISVYSMLAKLLEVAGKYDYAILLRQASLALAIQENASEEVAQIYRKMSKLYAKKHLPSLAHSSLSKSLEILQKFRQSITTAYANIAQVYLELGDIAFQQEQWEESTQQYRHGLEIQQQIGNPWLLAETYLRLAQSAQKQNRVAEVLQYCEKAKEICESQQDTVRLARTYNQIAQMHVYQKKFVEAKELYYQAQEMAWNYGDIATVGKIYNNLAAIALQDRDYFGAQRLYWRAGIILDRIGDMAGASVVYQNLALLKYSCNDLGGTKRYLERSLKYAQDTYLDTKSNKIQELLAELEKNNALSYTNGPELS